MRSYSQLTGKLLNVGLTKMCVVVPSPNEVSHEETVDMGSTRIEVKNERERTRVKRKGELLLQLKELIKQSCLTDAEDKRKRFTEV